MKPVIKKQVYYSMLLMRDDTSVKTLRVRGGTITFLFVFLLLIILGGAGGIWGGLHYWKKYAQLSERQQAQDRELAEARLQLERYVNYDTLLEAANGSAPLAKNEEIGAAAAAARTQNATQAAQVSARNATRPESAAVQGKAGANATLPQHNATTLAQATALADPAGPQTSPVPLISSDASPLRINGFVGRVVGLQRVRVRYELSTVPSEEQRTISGTAKYFVVLADGAEVEIPVQDTSDARFAISRMKLMEASLRLPQGLAAKDISQLHVSLELEEGKAYREAYPVTR